MKTTIVAGSWDASPDEMRKLIELAVDEIGTRHFINVYFQMEHDADIIFISDFVLLQDQMDTLWSVGNFHLAENVFEGYNFTNLLCNIRSYCGEYNESI
jgi:hypothetical protein